MHMELYIRGLLCVRKPEDAAYHTVFSQIDAHTQIHAHSPSSSSWHTKIGEIDDFYQKCMDSGSDSEPTIMLQLHVLLTHSALLLE